MKLNWGHLITAVIVLFIMGMAIMVFIATKQSNEMLDQNYYEKELKYQDVISASQNLDNITSEKIIKIENGDILFSIPKESISSEKINIEFIKPDNQRFDKQMRIIPSDEGIYKLPVSMFEKGIYKVRIHWTGNGKKYYREEEINL